MKKIISICTFICLAIALFIACPVFSASADTERAIYVYNTQGWKLCGYCYDADADEVLGDVWGEYELAPDATLGNYWYKYEIPQDAEGKNAMIIIFNKSKDRERITFEAPKGNKIYFNTYRSTGFASAEEASSEENNCKKLFPATGETKVYFYNTERWQTVSAYIWGTEEYLDGWPGTIATKDETRENWYYVVINQDCTKRNMNIIFNNDNNGEQASDVQINKDVLYVNIEGKTYDSYDACEAVTPMAKTAEDYMMDFSTIDTIEKTDSVIEYPSLLAPIVVLSIAGLAFVAVGAVLIVLFILWRRKNDL